MQTIRDPFLEAVRVTLGDRYTENMQNIYTIAITFILQSLVEGIEDALNSQLSHSSPAGPASSVVEDGSGLRKTRLTSWPTYLTLCDLNIAVTPSDLTASLPCDLLILGFIKVIWWRHHSSNSSFGRFVPLKREGATKHWHHAPERLALVAVQI